MDLKKAKAIIFVGDDYEDMELQYPKYRLLEAGVQVVLAGLDGGAVYHGKHGYPQQAQVSVSDLHQQGDCDFDVVVVPGGWMPDKLRRDEDVLEIVRRADQAGKCIASICHGPWINISAGVVDGRCYTSTTALKDDLTNAGAKWVDQSVVVDGHHVSSRRPDDLPDFMRATLKVLASQEA